MRVSVRTPTRTPTRARVCDDSDVDNSSVVFPTSGALERRLSWDGAAEDDAREARRRREVRRCSYLWG